MIEDSPTALAVRGFVIFPPLGSSELMTCAPLHKSLVEMTQQTVTVNNLNIENNDCCGDHLSRGVASIVVNCLLEEAGLMESVPLTSLDFS
jgi:hypothetical protein